MKKEQLPLIIGAAAVALVLILAAAIPALFVEKTPAEQPDVVLTGGERAALFDLYWTEDERCTVEQLERSDFAAEELTGSDELIRQLHGDLRFDLGEPVAESSGEHFFVLRREDGGYLRMQEYYEQSAGDWNNWFRVYVDIDSLDIYFLYESCKCLKNEEKYPIGVLPTAWDLIAAWQDYRGYDKYIYLGGDGNKASAAFLDGERAVYCDVNLTIYTSPEYVVDFRIVRKPPTDGVTTGEVAA